MRFHVEVSLSFRWCIIFLSVLFSWLHNVCIRAVNRFFYCSSFFKFPACVLILSQNPFIVSSFMLNYVNHLPCKNCVMSLVTQYALYYSFIVTVIIETMCHFAFSVVGTNTLLIMDSELVLFFTSKFICWKCIGFRVDSPRIFSIAVFSPLPFHCHLPQIAV